MVDDQINRVERVNLLGVATQGHNAVAHSGKVNHGRNAGEILHQHAGRAVSDLTGVLTTVCGPFGKRLNVVDGHGKPAILKAQQVFQHNFQGGGQLGKVTKASCLCGGN